MKKSFLAGLSPAEFLRVYWQKKPLLARAAFASHVRAVTRDQLFDLASRQDVESRVVLRARGRWEVRHGPFSRATIERLPRRGWTLLVQGVDIALPPAARLLREFAFIPSARLDDVMVSYAAPGGGVGPHFDSYDVFLVQSEGQRLWRVSAQQDKDLVPDAPLKVLRRFRPDNEWQLGPGDVLYLPPGYAHDGVAVDACLTYSVGFRAPSAQELGSRFLDFLQDRLALEGRYADPGLTPSRCPGRIPPALMQESRRTLARVRWSEADVAEFIGRYLSEPKANVVFERPAPRLSPAQFAKRANAGGVHLRPASRLLYRDRDLYMNGEAYRPGVAAARELRLLADVRALGARRQVGAEAGALLYDWYVAGYIGLGSIR